jgi:hypothetical protein
MEIYLAEDLTKVEARPEHDEKITIRILPLSAVLKLIRIGEIRDAKSVSGILFYASFVAAKHGSAPSAKRG